MIVDLKPCPFCGGKPRVTRDESDGGITIECPNCSKAWKDEKRSERWASDFGFYGWDESSDGAVIAAWNRRAADRPTCHDTSDNDYEFKCSNCSAYTLKPGNYHSEVGYVRDSGEHLRYCPNCGAEVVE